MVVAVVVVIMVDAIDHEGKISFVNKEKLSPTDWNHLSLAVIAIVVNEVVHLPLEIDDVVQVDPVHHILVHLFHDGKESNFSRR